MRPPALPPVERGSFPPFRPWSALANPSNHRGDATRSAASNGEAGRGRRSTSRAGRESAKTRIAGALSVTPPPGRSATPSAADPAPPSLRSGINNGVGSSSRRLSFASLPAGSQSRRVTTRAGTASPPSNPVAPPELSGTRTALAKATIAAPPANATRPGSPHPPCLLDGTDAFRAKTFIGEDKSLLTNGRGIVRGD